MNDKPFNERQQFVQAVSEVSKEIDPHELYRLFNDITMLRYLQATNTGYLALCPQQRTMDSPLILLETPTPLRSVRGVRKVLQITLPTLVALSDGQAIYGYNDPSALGADILLIQFQWPNAWQLTKNGRTIVRITSRVGVGVTAALDEHYFCTALRHVFGSSSQAVQKHLCELVRAAQRQRRGTNVLISGNAAEEALRLNSQCTRVRPFVPTPAIMEQITSLDGTVMIDPNGACHAIGAILDGFVSDRGDRRRGGRYNSALMYVDSCRIPSLILVVSEDGMVDLVFQQSRRGDR